MKNFVIVVQGGAGPDSEFIRSHVKEYEAGLAAAINAGHEVLKSKGTAVDAVFEAVKSFENNILFNCGRGAALNSKGEIQMDAAIMDGKSKKSGAVSLLKNVKNPIALAKTIMLQSRHVYLGGEGALNYAKTMNMELACDAYFVTEHRFDAYEKKRKETDGDNNNSCIEHSNQRNHGTVGAVALDMDGNVAAATSTGGSEYGNEGRIADSSMIGVGTFADNETCAVSCTGDGEPIMKHVVAHALTSWMKHKNKSVSQACKEVMREFAKAGDLGIIAVDTEGI